MHAPTTTLASSLTLASYLPPRLDQPTNPSQAGLVAATLIAFMLLAGVAALAVRQARRGSYVGLGCLCGAFCLSWGEPVYDYVFHLTFYTKGETLWAPFGINQPAWVVAGYVMAYGLLAWCVAERALRGDLTRHSIVVMLVIAWFACAASETLDYEIGAFEYYGHSIKLLGTPYWIEMFNAVFIVAVGLLIAAATPVLRRGKILIQLFVPTMLYMVTFTGVTYGCGYLALDVLNSPGSHTAWMWLAALGTNALALLLLWILVDFLELLPAYRFTLRDGPRLVKLNGADRGARDSHHLNGVVPLGEVSHPGDRAQRAT